MKKVLMVGNVACGKTTLLQALDNQPLEYKKTQSIEVIAGNIDSPGEYLERRVNLQNLLVTSVDTDLVLFLMDPTQDRYMYSGGQAMAFPVPVAGVITKKDLATEEQLQAFIAKVAEQFEEGKYVSEIKKTESGNTFLVTGNEYNIKEIEAM